MKALCLMACLLVSGTALPAHDIITTNLTFTRDISRILAAHCASCHAAGASIPLTSYEEVRPWAVSIKDQVLSRAMPPWGAVKGFGNLSPDLGLSQEDIMIIAAWVIGGAPQGSTQLLANSKATPAVRPPAPLRDTLVVETRVQLSEPVDLAGIRPIAQSIVASSRLTARLPDGRIVPLVWLYRFDPKMPRTFVFRRPVRLPSGTVISSSAPLRYALEAPKAPSPGQ